MCRDDHGALRFAGRADDLIVSAGYNISPAEVARVLREHPAIADARVAGAPDAVRGAVPVAEIVLKPSINPDGLTMALQQFLQGELAPYKSTAAIPDYRRSVIGHRPSYRPSAMGYRDRPSAMGYRDRPSAMGYRDRPSAIGCRLWAIASGWPACQRRAKI